MSLKNKVEISTYIAQRSWQKQLWAGLEQDVLPGRRKRSYRQRRRRPLWSLREGHDGGILGTRTRRHFLSLKWEERNILLSTMVIIHECKQISNTVFRIELDLELPRANAILYGKQRVCWQWKGPAWFIEYPFILLKRIVMLSGIARIPIENSQINPIRIGEIKTILRGENCRQIRRDW